MLTWQRLVLLSDAELARYDVAEVNLACAAGLPSAEKINSSFCLRALDQWAAHVRAKTQLRFWQFQHNPGYWDHSESKFRIHCMIFALQRDCGVRYNPAKIPADVPLEVEDSFIHGIIQGQGGTCASLPVVYAAVGRRLGYPLKLVAARTLKCGHCFTRWDEVTGERFNIKVNNVSWDAPPDDYYRTGMYQISPETEKAGCLLTSMTPKEELAGFLVQRAHHWLDAGRWRRAVESFAWACALVPRDRICLDTLNKTVKDWGRALEAAKPPDFPDIYLKKSPGRRYLGQLPWGVEQNILGLEVMENLLKNPDYERDWWRPLRQGVRPPRAIPVPGSRRAMSTWKVSVPAIRPGPRS